MKQLPVFFLIIISTLSLNAQQSIEGIWNTGKENTTIEIKNISNGWIGEIAASDNPKASKGKLMIKDIQKEKNGYKGKLYVAKKNKWVDALFEPTGKILLVTVSVGWKKKKIEWKKMNEVVTK